MKRWTSEGLTPNVQGHKLMAVPGGGRFNSSLSLSSFRPAAWIMNGGGLVTATNTHTLYAHLLANDLGSPLKRAKSSTWGLIVRMTELWFLPMKSSSHSIFFGSMCKWDNQMAAMINGKKNRQFFPPWNYRISQFQSLLERKSWGILIWTMISSWNQSCLVKRALNIFILAVSMKSYPSHRHLLSRQ